MKTITIREKVFTEYISEKELQLIVDRCASDIAGEVNASENVAVIGVLNGGIPFMQKVLEKSDAKVFVDYVKVVSYGDGTLSSGKVKLVLDTSLDLRGKKVMIIDDIYDTGFTVAFLKKHFKSKGASEVRSACLFFKKNSNAEQPDYYGYTVGDDFIIGYGLDYAGWGRNLKCIMRTQV